MPGLGEKLYNNLMNKPQLDDKDSEEKTQELKNSWNALAKFFSDMVESKYWNTLNQETMAKAKEFCSAMGNTVGNSTNISANDSGDGMRKNDTTLGNYEAFDKALEALFNSVGGYPAYHLTLSLDQISKNHSLDKINGDDQAKANQLPQPINTNAFDQIYINCYNNYKNQTSGLPTSVNVGKNLLQGLKGLQNYINANPTQKQSEELPALGDELTKNIKLAGNAVTSQQQKLDNIRHNLFYRLRNDLSNSHRFLGNSTEYGNMRDSATALLTKWENANAETREKLAKNALDLANTYIERKRGRHTENDWNPITKEGKKRRALAICLRKTALDLMGEYQTPPNEEKLKINLFNDDKSDIFETSTSKNNNAINMHNGIIEKKVDDIFKNNANNIIENEDENDISEKYEVDIINTNPESSRKRLIEDQAIFKLNDYTIEYMLSNDNVSGTKDDLVAKAVAVNVLMQMGITGAFDSEYTPKQIFSEQNIENVADAVKQLHSSKNNMNELENKVLKMGDRSKKFTFMDQNDIEPLISSMYKRKLIGVPKEGPAKITSTQPKQGMHTNDNKSNVKGMKP